MASAGVQLSVVYAIETVLNALDISTKEEETTADVFSSLSAASAVSLLWLVVALSNCVQRHFGLRPLVIHFEN